MFSTYFRIFHTVSDRRTFGDIHVENEDVSLNCHLYTPHLQSVFLASDWSVILVTLSWLLIGKLFLVTLSCLLIGQTEPSCYNLSSVSSLSPSKERCLWSRAASEGGGGGGGGVVVEVVLWWWRWWWRCGGGGGDGGGVVVVKVVDAGGCGCGGEGGGGGGGGDGGGVVVLEVWWW